MKRSPASLPLRAALLTAALCLATSVYAQDFIPEQRAASLLGASSDRVTVANVRWGFDTPRGPRPSQQTPDQKRQTWQPRFKDTTIKLDQVKDVYLLIEPFKPEWLAAHAILGFDLGKGAVVSADGRRARGLALSVEAHLKQGQGYDLIRGMKNEFGIVYQLGTLADTYQKVLGRQEHRLVRYRLDLTPEQKQELLRNAIAEATRDRSGEHYHTTRNSCYQNVQRIVDTVLPRKQQVRDWLFRIPLPGGKSFGLYNPLATWPKLAPFAMRKVIAPGSRVELRPRSSAAAR